MTFIPKQLTFEYSLNGFRNLSTELAAQGWTGGDKLGYFGLINNSATAAYINFTATSANPADGTKGVLVSTSAPGAAWAYQAQDANYNALDASKVILYSGGAVTVKIVVIAGRS